MRPHRSLQDGQRDAQEGPRTAQEGAKTALEAPKTVHEASTTAPIHGKRERRGWRPLKTHGIYNRQEAIKIPPRRPKACPRGPPNRPGGHQDGPRGPQDGPRGLHDRLNSWGEREGRLATRATGRRASPETSTGNRRNVRSIAGPTIMPLARWRRSHVGVSRGGRGGPGAGQEEVRGGRGAQRPQIPARLCAQI